MKTPISFLLVVLLGLFCLIINNTQAKENPTSSLTDKAFSTANAQYSHYGKLFIEGPKCTDCHGSRDYFMDASIASGF